MRCTRTHTHIQSSLAIVTISLIASVICSSKLISLPLSDLIDTNVSRWNAAEEETGTNQISSLLVICYICSLCSSSPAYHQLAWHYLNTVPFNLRSKWNRSFCLRGSGNSWCKEGTCAHKSECRAKETTIRTITKFIKCQFVRDEMLKCVRLYVICIWKPNWFYCHRAAIVRSAPVLDASHALDSTSILLPQLYTQLREERII